MTEINASDLLRIINTSSRRDFPDCLVAGNFSLNLSNPGQINFSGSTFKNRFEVASHSNILLHLNNVTFEDYVHIQIARGTLNCENTSIKTGSKIACQDNGYLNFKNAKAIGL